MSPAACIAFTSLAVAALLVAEWRGHRGGIWLSKPLASLGFVATALALGVDGSYPRLIFAGLLACVVGDVLLIVRDREAAFKAGIAAFAIGHLLYAAAFLRLAVDVPTLAVGSALLGLAGYGVWRWLAPHVPPSLAAAVVVYIAIISVMVAAAYAVSRAGADLRIALGATLFFLSDLSVARDSFVNRSFVNRAWGLPTYYAAQITLALSAGG